MSAHDYKIFQAQIANKDPNQPRSYTVIQIPEGYKLVGVQLPSALKDQSAPLIGSIVLVLQLDSYRAYILSVLREPYTFLSANNQFRGSIPSTGDASEDIAVGANPVQDGEIFFEATGPASPTGEGTPGFGAHLYLGNNGSAEIGSGSMGERLVVGGTGSDDDHEVVLSADNGFVESNVDDVTFVKSTYNWDDENNMEFGNVIADPTDESITIPLAELSIDSVGNLELFNTTFGTGLKLGSLVMDTVGNMSLSANLAGVPKATISLSNTGTVNINSGTFGAARLNDATLANPTTDPAFYEFWVQQAAIFAAIPNTGTPPEPVASALQAALIALLNTFPQSLTAKISSASATVTIGG